MICRALGACTLTMRLRPRFSTLQAYASWWGALIGIME
jgi:hypothetical protein